MAVKETVKKAAKTVAKKTSAVKKAVTKKSGKDKVLTYLVKYLNILGEVSKHTWPFIFRCYLEDVLSDLQGFGAGCFCYSVF